MRAIRGWVWIMVGTGCLVGSLGTLLLPGHLGGVIAGAMAVAFDLLRQAPRAHPR